MVSVDVTSWFTGAKVRLSIDQGRLNRGDHPDDGGGLWIDPDIARDMVIKLYFTTNIARHGYVTKEFTVNWPAKAGKDPNTC